ncbi:MAG: DUF2007 domain-containing protein [Planctomycetes bacterium]|jgi:hypothetical protein|nr:DUF2007 domain-containing protein [Planctomycetota bacterium]
MTGRDRHDEGEWVEALVAANLAEADLVRSMLEAAGISARIEAESSAAMLDGFLGLGRFVKVEVPAADLEEALAILEEAREIGGLSGEEE